MFIGLPSLPMVKDDERRTPIDLKATNKEMGEFTFDDKQDKLRLMQKVLANQVQINSEECLQVLKQCEWDVHKAIKVIQLKETLKQQLIVINDCDWIQILTKYNWQVNIAVSHFVAKQTIGDHTTAV